MVLELKNPENIGQNAHNYGVRHLAVIMDGNRRWAKSNGLSVLEGHKEGTKALKSLVKTAPKFGIEYLTAYAFSTENWKRPEAEKNVIFALLKEVTLAEMESLHENNVRVSFIGDLNAFSKDIVEVLDRVVNKTKNNTGLKLQIALNYGALDEFACALNTIKDSLSKSEIEELKTEDFSKYLYTSKSPDPEIVLRTGGENRLSNYLLWQSANSKLEFTEVLWPSFSEENLENLLKEYAKERC